MNLTIKKQKSKKNTIKIQLRQKKTLNFKNC